MNALKEALSHRQDHQELEIQTEEKKRFFFVAIKREGYQTKL